MEENQDIIFDRNTVEFVTVAAEYCAFLERSSGMGRGAFVDTAVKILPLLYLKALLLPECEALGFEELETCVTEASYEAMRASLASILGEKDDYLEVFTPDMVYSEEALPGSISEDLADIYQALRDFIFVFKQGNRETMHDSVAVCREGFSEYWGQTLVNTLRALHEVKFKRPDTDEETPEEGGMSGYDLPDDGLEGFYNTDEEE